MSFTFKINEKSLQNVEKNVREAFDKVIRSNAMMNEIGAVVTNDVKEQTRKGKSIPNGSKLKALSSKWIDRRKELAKSNDTDEAYQAEKSNLTFTGQLLNSIRFIIPGPGKIKIFFDGMHDPYKNKDGENIGGRVSNQLIADGQTERGRPFVGVRPVIERRIGRIIRTYLKRALIVSRFLSRGVDN